MLTDSQFDDRFHGDDDKRKRQRFLLGVLCALAAVLASVLILREVFE